MKKIGTRYAVIKTETGYKWQVSCLFCSEFRLFEVGDEPVNEVIQEFSLKQAFEEGWRSVTDKYFCPSDKTRVYFCPTCTKKLKDDAARGRIPFSIDLSKLTVGK